MLRLPWALAVLATLVATISAPTLQEREPKQLRSVSGAMSPDKWNSMITAIVPGIAKLNIVYDMADTSDPKWKKGTIAQAYATMLEDVHSRLKDFEKEAVRYKNKSNSLTYILRMEEVIQDAHSFANLIGKSSEFALVSDEVSIQAYKSLTSIQISSISLKTHRRAVVSWYEESFPLPKF